MGGDAASKTDGALKTAGGLGVEKKAHIGTGLTVDAGGATITAGGFEVTSGTSALQAVTATTFVGSGDADASDSTTAAVKTAGGLAVAKKVHIGTGLTVDAGTSTLQAVTATTFAGSDTGDAASKTAGALKTAGGLGVEKKAHIGTGLTVDAGGATVTAGGFTVTSGTSALQAVTATTFAGSDTGDAASKTD